MLTPENIFAISPVALMFAARLFELSRKRNTVPGTVRENYTLPLFIATGALMFVCALFEFFSLRHVINPFLYAAGLVAGLSAFLLRHRAISALGQFWSLHVEIRANHEFVRRGPFRWVRHPVYLSMLLELLAPVLMFRAWYSFWLIPLLFTPILLRRLRLEEHAMVEKFGDAYRSYQQTTSALIPLKWPPIR